MVSHIQLRTAIPQKYLGQDRADFRQARVGQRMSWAADRKTTRVEDIAYCLFGIFDVNMPLLYGEGLSGHPPTIPFLLSRPVP